MDTLSEKKETKALLWIGRATTPLVSWGVARFLNVFSFTTEQDYRRKFGIWRR